MDCPGRRASITRSGKLGLMPIEYIKFSHAAGELSPELHGRGDLEGFRFGYREGLNVMPDWRGGLRTRPGTLMCEPLFLDPDNPGVRLSTFSFNTEPEDNYLLVWKHRKLYFVQNGGYLIDPSRGTRGNDMLTRYDVGDIVRVYRFNEINGYAYTGKVAATDRVDVAFKDVSLTVNPNYYVYKVINIATPYSGEELFDLKFSQFRDEIILTHQDYPVNKLVRTGFINFVIRAESFAPRDPVEGLTTTIENRDTAYAKNTGGAQWAVSEVLNDGREMPIPYPEGDVINTNIGTKLAVLSWDYRADTSKYRVYASAWSSKVAEALGNPGAENPLTGTPATGVPGRPSSFTLVSIEYSTQDFSLEFDVTIQVNAPESHGGSDILYYEWQWQRYVEFEGWRRTSAPASNSSPITLQFTWFQAFSLRVRAVNDEGPGDYYAKYIRPEDFP